MIKSRRIVVDYAPTQHEQAAGREKTPMGIPYSQCRLYRHAWEEIGAPLAYPFKQRWPNHIWLRCLRCTAERYDAFDHMGHLATRKYVHPDDYRISRDERPTIEQLRLVIIKERRK